MLSYCEENNKELNNQVDKTRNNDLVFFSKSTVGS